MGRWQKHPLSPIARGYVAGARPAGRVIAAGGRLIRLAQVGDIRSNLLYYGKGVRAFEIVKLSPEEYEEREISDAPISQNLKRERWNKNGMHHLDAHAAESGRWLACVDGFRYIYLFGRGRRMTLKEFFTR